ncbi:phosphotransferase family protein [Phytoactinopolyspora limicola]|uniref:phosphotransferase family protein n=1 Tax=Phytoactinopolyspora limicola TaxID=2715536 RepID=UPI00140C9299|nr:aminoglycoside phosphotransferase family protein [Phytoactinopolyspora limicola]
MTLTPAQAIDFVRTFGLVSGPQVRAAPLGGGVSNDTVVVDDGSTRIVVKRALARLRTPVEWHASADRALAEAEVLRLVAGITPEYVPPVLATDPDTATMAIAAAPADWRDWKTDLLAGTVHPVVAETLGTVLGTWRRASSIAPAGAGSAADTVGVLRRLDGMDRMEALRLRPFHAVVAQRHPDLAETIADVATTLRSARHGLVHGDFSPKNVLVGASGLWVIDFEVAHHGHPVFDVAFLQTHLLLKAVAMRRMAHPLRVSAGVFTDAHRRAAGLASAASAATGAAAAEPVAERAAGPAVELARNVGCLLLARVDGTSCVDYLDPPAVEWVRQLGRRLVGGVTDLDETWDEVVDER